MFAITITAKLLQNDTADSLNLCVLVLLVWPTVNGIRKR